MTSRNNHICTILLPWFLIFFFLSLEVLVWALVMWVSVGWEAEFERTTGILLKRQAGYVWKIFRFQISNHSCLYFLGGPLLGVGKIKLLLVLYMAACWSSFVCLFCCCCYLSGTVATALAWGSLGIFWNLPVMSGVSLAPEGVDSRLSVACPLWNVPVSMSKCHPCPGYWRNRFYVVLVSLVWISRTHIACGIKCAMCVIQVPVAVVIFALPDCCV